MPIKFVTLTLFMILALSIPNTNAFGIENNTSFTEADVDNSLYLKSIHNLYPKGEECDKSIANAKKYLMSLSPAEFHAIKNNAINIVRISPVKEK
jgi:hypothetical protein